MSLADLSHEECIRYAFDQNSNALRVEGALGAHSSTEVTVTVDTSPYANGDQIDSVLEADGIIGGPNEDNATLVGVTLVDASSQESDLEIWFFDHNVTTVSSDNDAFNVSDSNMTSFMGAVIISKGDYLAAANNSVAYVPAEVPLRQDTSQSSPGVYLVIVSRGTPTYSATTDLNLRLHYAY